MNGSYYTRVINECAWGLRRRAQECAPYRHTVVDGMGIGG